MTKHDLSAVIATLATEGSLPSLLTRTLRRLVALSGGTAGVLEVCPPRSAPITVTVGSRRALAALRARASTPGDVLPRPAGPAGRGLGRLMVGGGRAALPAGFRRDLGRVIHRRWQEERRALRMSLLTEITRLLGSADSLDEVLRTFGNGLARFVAFDALAVLLVDAERGEFEVLDVTARTVPTGIVRDQRLPLDGTLVERVLATRTAVRVDDLTDHAVPSASRATLGARGWRSAVVVPLLTQGGVFGAVSLVAAEPAAFDDEAMEGAAELAQPLASAIEQRRLLHESRRRADEVAALYATSQLITARLDVASVLDRISRSVTALIGSTGCGIGGKVPSSCFMLVQWNNGKFSRVYPTKKGTFDCTTSNRYTFQADLTTP